MQWHLLCSPIVEGGLVGDWLKSGEEVFVMLSS